MTGKARGPRDVLIVVDVQNDFCPGGALPVADGDAIVPLVNDIARRFEVVVLTQDWHPKGHVSFATSHGRLPFSMIDLAYGRQVLWPDHCVQGTKGAEFHPALSVPHAQAIIRKGHHPNVDSYSGFREADRATPTGLAGYLREREAGHVYVCGLATDFCVAWTAFDAVAAGWNVSVIADACRAIELDGSLDAAFEEMSRLGIARVNADEIA